VGLDQAERILIRQFPKPTETKDVDGLKIFICSNLLETSIPLD